MFLSKRSRFFSLAVTGALVLSLLIATTGAIGGISRASADDQVSATVPVRVTRIDGTIPLIIGGTVVILNEEAASTAPVTTFNYIDGFESLDLHFQQSSTEQFTSTDFATARSISGTANGKITATRSSDGQTAATGSYKLTMSNTAECQMRGDGTWSMESDKFTVSGTVVTCVNWDASIENFTGYVQVNGDLVMKQETEQQSGGLLGGLVRGLLGGLFR